MAEAGENQTVHQSFAEKYRLSSEELDKALTHDFKGSRMQVPLLLLNEKGKDLKVDIPKINFQIDPDKYITEVAQLFIQAKGSVTPESLFASIYPTPQDLIEYFQAAADLVPTLVYSMYFLKTGQVKYFEKLRTLTVKPASIVRYIAKREINFQKQQITSEEGSVLDGVSAIIALNLVKNAYQHGLNHDLKLRLKPDELEVENLCTRQFDFGQSPPGHYGNLIVDYYSQLSGERVSYEQNLQPDGNYQIICRLNLNEPADES